MDIGSYIHRQYEALIRLGGFERSPSDRPDTPDRLCEYGHKVSSGSRLCSYGHRPA